MASSRTLSRPATTQDDIPAWAGAHTHVHIDIGTGDGTYALRVARSCPDTAVIGVDTCLDNLTKMARKPLANLRFVATDATQRPAWLPGTATSVSINFPYGSLLHAVAGDDCEALAEILAVAGPGATIDIRVNGSAGAEYGFTVDLMRDRIGRALRQVSPRSAKVTVLPQHELRSFPSTWAKRLAYGRPSQVILATARMGI